MTLISQQFVYGENHEARPIALFVGLWLAVWIGFAAAYILLRRGHQIPLWAIIAVGLAARAILLPSNLIQENDPNRYVLDGEAIIHGVNPFAHSPEEVTSKGPAHFKAALATDDAQNILTRISYQDVPTIYPPLAQLSFAAGAILTPWDWMGQRIIFLLYDVATIAALIVALRAWGKPFHWVILYAWNPLVIKEIANSAHSDSLAALCFALLLWSLAPRPAEKMPLMSILAGLALAGAVLARLYPLMLAPAVLVYVMRKAPSWRNAALFCQAFAFAIILAYLPFTGVGLEQVTEGLRTYTSEWKRNEGAFALFMTLGPAARTASTLTIVAVALAAAARLWSSPARPSDLAWTVQTTLLAWILLTPASYPWYAVGLITISVVRPQPYVVVLSGAYAAYYLNFLYLYHDYPETWNSWTKAIEHGAIWLALIVPWVRRPRQARNPSRV
jgi:hypothetical protein